MELSVIGIEMMIDRRLRYNRTERSSMESEEKWTKNRALRNTVEKLKERGFYTMETDFKGPRG